MYHRIFSEQHYNVKSSSPFFHKYFTIHPSQPLYYNMSVFNTIKVSSKLPPLIRWHLEDEDHSYEVFIDASQVTKVQISQHTGDIYITAGNVFKRRCGSNGT